MLLSCRLTNVQVLQLSTLLFTLFVVAEVVAAYFSQSLSLLGDAAAMSIDVFTVSTCHYFFVILVRAVLLSCIAVWV